MEEIHSIAVQCIGTKFQIKIISVDGDRFYDPKFSISFDLLPNEFFINFTTINLDSILDFFEKCDDLFIISDFLHLLKNFRSRLLTDLLVINPKVNNPPINSQVIEEILKLGPALTDKGSLAKLHDCHPLNIFTIGNSIKFFSNQAQKHFSVSLY